MKKHLNFSLFLVTKKTQLAELRYGGWLRHVNSAHSIMVAIGLMTQGIGL